MILGLGKAVPERILTNHDLEKMVDTSDEWIRTRTGIQRRHIADDKTLHADLSAQAARAALEDAGVKAEELDTIIVGTVTADHGFPSSACYIQDKIGAVNASAFDISAACSGFLYALSLADALIRSGKATKVLVIGAELLSRITDWTDRSTCVLFGDGAGAAVVGPAQNGAGILDTYMKSDGRLTQLLYMPGGGCAIPAEVAANERLNYIRMEGPEVFKAAVTAMGDAATHILERNGMTGDDVDLLIPHQANIRIIRATAKRVGLSEDRVYINIQEYGNTSAASIPIALAEAREKGILKQGMTALLVAFGGGFTWGSAIVRF